MSHAQRYHQWFPARGTNQLIVQQWLYHYREKRRRFLSSRPYLVNTDVTLFPYCLGCLHIAHAYHTLTCWRQSSGLRTVNPPQTYDVFVTNLRRNSLAIAISKSCNYCTTLIWLCMEKTSWEICCNVTASVKHRTTIGCLFYISITSTYFIEVTLYVLGGWYWNLLHYAKKEHAFISICKTYSIATHIASSVFVNGLHQW